ncbi:MAG: hypothetical protein ABH884_04095 [Candidatus Komeilibacteria bacterium]
MDFATKQIKAVEAVRRLNFSDFDQIELTGDAVRILVNLFLNPDCMSDINLEQYIKEERVKLADLSKHIITACPSTLAKYADDHNQLLITRDDMIKCFSLDHLHAIADHKMEKVKNPSYALAHILTMAKIETMKDQQGQVLANLIQNKIVYKNVLVPSNLKVQTGQLVWHHFGVVIDEAQTQDYQQHYHQLDECYYWQMYNNVKKQTINFADQERFHKDIVHGILKEDQKRTKGKYQNTANKKNINKAVENNTGKQKIKFTN